VVIVLIPDAMPRAEQLILRILLIPVGRTGGSKGAAASSAEQGLRKT